MFKNGIKNNFFLPALICLVSIGLTFGLSNAYAFSGLQYGSDLLPSFNYLNPTASYMLPLSPAYQFMTFNNPFIGIWNPIPIPPKPKPKPKPPVPVSVVISIDATNEGELTGDMLVKFDIQGSATYPYPKNYDYFFDGYSVFRDTNAYVHTPLSPCLCPILSTDALTVEISEIVKCCCRCCEKKGEAIYSFNIKYPGVYKIREYVWAKDCGHDSFYVEIKRGDKRIPFPAFTTDPTGDLVLVKKAHDRFELTGKYNEWHWRNVSHWNAYVSPKEKAYTCYYFLKSGDYKLIYTTRESLTRLRAVEIVRLWPKPIPLDIADQETFELESVQDYFNLNEVGNTTLGPKVEDLPNLNIQADEIFLGDFTQ